MLLQIKMESFSINLGLLTRHLHAPCSMLYALCPMLYALCSLLSALTAA